MSIEKTPEVGHVILEKIDSVAQLTLSRPSALNAMTIEMYLELEEHLIKLSEDNSVRVLVIRGAGDKAFAAGTDISHFQNYTGADGIEYERRIDRIINLLEGFPKPTIAAINGVAVGGGLIITAACDLRYGTSKSRFGAPVARTLGNCLSISNYERLADVLGTMRTKELLYTARLVSAEEAASIDFLTAVLEEKDFFASVLEIAGKISKNAPLTVDATKEAFIRIKANDNLNKPASNFDDIVSKVYGSKDFSEGVTSYMEKRTPVWKGN